MKNIRTLTLAPVLLLLGLIATPVLAQQDNTTSATAPTAKTHSASKAKKHIDAVKERISDLHSDLKITDQQSRQWNALAQVMRDNAEATGKRMQQIKHASQTLNAQQNMQAYAELAQQHADNMQKMSAAFTELYNVLSADQKTTADALFQHRALHHRARHAAASSKRTP